MKNIMALSGQAASVQTGGVHEEKILENTPIKIVALFHFFIFKSGNSPLDFFSMLQLELR